jgi:hypothetical protein
MQRRGDDTVTLRIVKPKDVEDLTSDQKLELIRSRLRGALMKRVVKCKEEADGLQHDMTMAAERLDEKNFMAEISAIKVASYHINQTELLVLRRVWLMVNSIVGGQDCDVDDGEDDEST